MTRFDPSRREFLATSAVGLLGIAGFTRRSVEASDSELIYVGTYTEGGREDGIYLVRMDSRTGALRQVGAVKAGANPSFLAIHPNGRVLYAVNETEERNGRKSGGVTSLRIAGDSGSLTRINEQASEGGAPCYVSVDRRGRSILVANYVGGSVALLPIQQGGGLAAATHVDQHVGKGPNAERQEGPHAHCVMPDPSNRYALATDLGNDLVMVYRLGADGRSLTRVPAADAHMRAGAGPRHIAFHPKRPLVFVASELDSTVTVLRFDSGKGTLTTLASYSTLPADFKAASYVADIHVADSGRTLYVSNRGHNSVAVFSVAGSDGALKLEQHVSTQGDWPRNFSLHPSGKWLLVANQRSNSIVVYSRDSSTGFLTPTSPRLEVPSPVCLRFRSIVA